jgi:hypothetical protein
MRNNGNTTTTTTTSTNQHPTNKLIRNSTQKFNGNPQTHTCSKIPTLSAPPLKFSNSTNGTLAPAYQRIQAPQTSTPPLTFPPSAFNPTPPMPIAKPTSLRNPCAKTHPTAPTPSTQTVRKIAVSWGEASLSPPLKDQKTTISSPANLHATTKITKIAVTQTLKETARTTPLR